MEEEYKKVNKLSFKDDDGVAILVNKFVDSEKDVMCANIELIKDEKMLNVLFDSNDSEFLDKLIKALNSIRKELDHNF